MNGSIANCSGGIRSAAHDRRSARRIGPPAMAAAMLKAAAGSAGAKRARKAA